MVYRYRPGDQSRVLSPNGRGGWTPLRPLNQPGSRSCLFSRDTGGWQPGCGGWGRGAGFTCSARLMVALLPVGPLTSKASCAQGARGCPNSRQQAGSCEVQHWGFLSPLGFTHPLSMRRVSPPPAPLCVRVCFNYLRALGLLS